jgi:hypothetical protein
MPRETSIDRPQHVKSRFRERALAELARQQHGVVSRRQVISLEFGRDAIAHRIAVGRFHVVFPGAYAVGHTAIGQEGRWTAAVLASGQGAVLSHRSAACLWGLRIEAPKPDDVTIARSTGPIRGLRRHRSILLPDELAVRDGIPVTCVARTLVDIAAGAAPWEFERAVREAEFLRLPQTPSLEEIYERRRGRRGTKLVSNPGEPPASSRRNVAQRLGGSLPPIRPQGWPSRPGDQRSLAVRGHHLRGGLCMARAACRRRARWAPGTRHQVRLRGRPHARPKAASTGLARRSDHLAPPQSAGVPSA